MCLTLAMHQTHININNTSIKAKQAKIDIKNKQKILKIMLGYRQTRPCRNGPSCYFYRTGNCWFYHPDWHSDFNNNNDEHNMSIEIQHVPEDENSESHSFNEESNFSSNFEFHPFRYNPFRGYFNEMDLQIANWGLQKKNQVAVKKQKKPKSLQIKQKDIPLVDISSSLPGHKKWYFQNIPHYKHFPQNQSEQCPICLSQFTETQLVSMLYCCHSFHISCIQKWLQSSTNCPLCRKDYRKHEKYEHLEGYSDNEISESECSESHSISGVSYPSISWEGDSQENESYEQYEDGQHQFQFADQMSFDNQE